MRVAATVVFAGALGAALKLPVGATIGLVAVCVAGVEACCAWSARRPARERRAVEKRLEEMRAADRRAKNRLTD